MLFAAFGFGLLGFLDDVLGGEDRGFKGHLRALAHGRLTTGMLKLIGGAAIALVLAVRARLRHRQATALRRAADRAGREPRQPASTGRPGRVIKFSLVAYVPIAIVAGAGPVGIAVAPLMGATLGLLPEDLHERLMLGDTGANVLGGRARSRRRARVRSHDAQLVLFVLIALNLASEFVSFSRVIERVPPLRWLDQLGRAKVPPPTRRGPAYGAAAGSQSGLTHIPRPWPKSSVCS